MADENSIIHAIFTIDQSHFDLFLNNYFNSEINLGGLYMGLFDIFKKKESNLEHTDEFEINKYLFFVMNMINDLIDNQFECDRSQLKYNGAIFYMNGQNGTKFDWQINEHISPFVVFYKNGKGAIKLLIYDDGTAFAYYYLKGANNPSNTINAEFSKETAKDIVVLMYTISDCKGKFNQKLSDLDFTYNCIDTDNLKFEEERI